MQKYVDLEIKVNSKKIFKVHKFLIISRSKKFEMLIKANNLQKTFDNEDPNYEKIEIINGKYLYKHFKIF